MPSVVEMVGIHKEFPGIIANDHVNLTLNRGEILAILGENGAGKSTLMSILFGLYQPDSGSIKINGQEARITNPTVAGQLGIGMVHQHFKLVHNFTVTENIILGMEPHRAGMLSLKAAAAKIRKISEQYGLEVDPLAKIEDISVGMQQRVEILKMLYRDSSILIFDEPTAVLTPQEISELMKIMKNLQAEGKSLLLITHKLKEIKAIADRCTVIRRGRVMGTVDVATTNEAQMAEMMVGRTVSFNVEKAPQRLGNPILEIKNLQVSNHRQVPALKNFSLDVRAGEIVGIAGVEGNGQSELVEALTGLRRCDGGQVLLNGRDITRLGIRAHLEAGLAHIPEDRQKRGLVLDFLLGSNFVLENHHTPPFSRRGFLKKSEIKAQAERLISTYDVRCGEGSLSSTRSLSGGNQQKAVIGREIDRNPDILVAVQPTRGLDVGAVEYIHKRIIEQRDKGKAVLLVSLELDEVLDLSDRIAVLCRGELVGVVDAGQTSESEIGLMMTGIVPGGLS